MTETAKKQQHITARKLKKGFGGNHVLRGIDLTVERGESLVIIGGSGSGKSVLLKCILGLLEPDSGQIRIGEQITTHLPENERFKLMRRFGMLFQSGALFDSMPVWENVSFGLLGDGCARPKARSVAIDKLGLVGLDARVADLMPAELSGGMQKRVSLARAICQEPEIIFYDEPTTGLDPIMSDVINRLIVKLNKELNITSVTITHDMNSAYTIADRIAMLYEGQIIAEGNVDEIRASRDAYVHQFITGSAEGPIQLGQKR